MLQRAALPDLPARAHLFGDLLIPGTRGNVRIEGSTKLTIPIPAGAPADVRAYEFAAGAVFGAYQDKLRLRKNNTGKKPSRAYIVRDNNDKAIAKATKRIEAQRNQRTGERIRVTGRVVGWNQFRPWRGNGANAGYFIFPDIRAHEPEIVETYGDAIDKLTKRAFPD